MENNNQDSGINRLEKKLYGSRPVNPEQERAELYPHNYDVKNTFGDTAEISTMKKDKDIKTPILRTLFIASAIFFLSALGISLYFFLGGSNIISADNIDLSLSGPISVKGGEDFVLQILVSNKNNISLKAAQLTVEYPEGAKVPKNDSLVANRFTKQLGDVANNSVVNETVKAALFGEENSEQEIKVTLEYRTEGSNATFVKQKSYKTFISSSPLSLSLDLPPDTNSGKDLVVNVKVNSNSSEVIKDTILRVVYPSGFAFRDATPSPTYGDSMWTLGDLLAKGERSVVIRGSLRGQDSEVKTFRADVGTRTSPDDNKIGLVYGSSLQSLVVKKPFIGINIALNGDTSNTDYIANGSELIRGDIGWTNNLPVKILNGELTMKMNGQVVDRASVSAGQGFYSSADGTISWNKLNGNFPQSIEPGQTGDQSFSFNFMPLVSGRRSIFENPSIDLEVTFRGTRFTEGNDSGSIVEYTVGRKINLSSDLQLTARTVYYAGPFKNVGTLPPTADRETTYTIIWSLVNSSNNVRGAVVKAELPSYVKWMNNFSPQSEKLSYNPVGGEITWNVGDIQAGSGILSEPREVAFQVSLTPSISQIGQYPSLLSDIMITGTDLFTNMDISNTKRTLNIQLTTDPGLKGSEGGAVRQ